MKYNQAVPKFPSDFKAVDKTYSLYGKLVRSNYPMPLPEVNSSKPDITFTFRGIVPKLENHPSDNQSRIWRQMRDGRLLRYYYSLGHMHEFRFSRDGSVVSFFQSWPEWRDTLFPLLNPVMAVSVTLLGGTALHASSLVLNKKSTLIMGISGAGKSTLSAALAVQKLCMHSDDIAVIEWNDKGIPVVMAGYPRIKIEAGLREHLGLTGLPLIPIISEKKKTGIPADLEVHIQNAQKEKWLPAEQLPGGFHSDAAALSAIIILDKRKIEIDKPQIERLRPVDAVMALTGHMYGREWLNRSGPVTLKVCTRLAKTVPVYRVHMPDNPGLLIQSARYIREKIIETPGYD